MSYSYLLLIKEYKYKNYRDMELEMFSSVKAAKLFKNKGNNEKFSRKVIL